MEGILLVVIIALIIYLIYNNMKMSKEIENTKKETKDIDVQINKINDLDLINDINNPNNIVEYNSNGEPIFNPFIYDRYYNPYYYPNYSYYAYEPRPVPVYHTSYRLYNPHYRKYRYYNREYNHIKNKDIKNLHKNVK